MDETFQRSSPGKLFEGEEIFKNNFITITLKLSKEMAYRVYDEFAQYEMQTDGGFIAQLTMPEGDWVYNYLATFGEHCEVLSPEDVRMQMRDRLQKTLRHYL